MQTPQLVFIAPVEDGVGQPLTISLFGTRCVEHRLQLSRVRLVQVKQAAGVTNGNIHAAAVELKLVSGAVKLPARGCIADEQLHNGAIDTRLRQGASPGSADMIEGEAGFDAHITRVAGTDHGEQHHQPHHHHQGNAALPVGSRRHTRQRPVAEADRSAPVTGRASHWPPLAGRARYSSGHACCPSFTSMVTRIRSGKFCALASQRWCQLGG